MAIMIRQLLPEDKSQWLPLWQAYLEFYETDLDGAVTETTWSRLMDSEFGIYGLCATDDDGDLVGIVHYLFHPVTWSNRDRCYLEDLYAVPAVRGQGVGRKLIEAVYAAADAHGADQVYWLTQDFNHTARRLYDRIAHKTPFIKYARQD